MTVENAIRFRHTFLLAGEGVDPLRGFVEECLRRVEPPLAETLIDRIVIAAGEAAGNIRRHAYLPEEPAGPCHLLLEVTPGEVRLELIDSGIAFTFPSTAPPPRVESGASGGLGLFIIQEAAGEVRHSRGLDGNNHLLLIFKRGPVT